MSHEKRFEIECYRDIFYGEHPCPVNDFTSLMKFDREYHNNGAPLACTDQRSEDFFGRARTALNVDEFLRTSNLDNKRSLSGTIQEHMRILEMEAFYLMYKLNISSILIEFKPCEKDGDSTNPVELTLEPFGNSKRLGLIKRCFGRKKK